MATADTVKTTVLKTAALNCGQAMTYAKFRTPTKVPGLPMVLSEKASKIA
jgi:hypothetical protein